MHVVVEYVHERFGAKAPIELAVIDFSDAAGLAREISGMLAQLYQIPSYPVSHEEIVQARKTKSEEVPSYDARIELVYGGRRVYEWPDRGPEGSGNRETYIAIHPNKAARKKLDAWDLPKELKSVLSDLSSSEGL